MKILMFGPAKGHNVKRFLDYFQRSPEHELYYFYFTKLEHYDLSHYDRIYWIPYYKPFRLFKTLRKRLDFLWVHNWTPLSVLLFILIFRRRDVPINFNVWSEPVPLKARSKTFKGAFYRFFFRRCRTVQCTWFSTYDHIKTLKGVNPVLLRWGMEEGWFREDQNAPYADETKEFLQRLPKGKLRFFFPKSLGLYNRHDLIIEACHRLVAEGRQNFVIYFWLGNHNPPEKLEEYGQRIEKRGLAPYIELVEHSFLPLEDIKAIWKAMDVGLQILDKDQFSTSIQEAMLLKKEVVASDIPPYRKFEEQYGLDLALIPNEEKAIATRMGELLDGERTDEEELEKRKKVLEKEYRFDKNIERMLSFFQEAPSSS
ncbi:MAG: glycosyltransferase [Flavobacteriales bacterium]